MSNDITGIDGYTNTKNYITNNYQPVCKTEKKDSIEVDKSSMIALGFLGQAKVNLDNNRIHNSVEKFLNDPNKVEYYNDFCDDLVLKGHSLESAIYNTDLVFEVLKDKKIY